MMNTILSNKKTPKKIKHKSKKFCYSDQLMKYEYKIKKIWEIKQIIEKVKIININLPEKFKIYSYKKEHS